MQITFPLKLSKGAWPQRKGVCGVCDASLKDSVVYISAGSSADIERSTIVDQDTFWYCGEHTSDSEVRKGCNIAVVHEKDDDQFYLSFCSVECLEEFFATIVAAMRKQSSSK